MTATLEQRSLSDRVSSRALDHLRRFRAEARRHFPGRVTRVVLFGSRARGDARRDSDYDVAVFIENLSDRRTVDHALADIAYPHILAGVHIRPVAVPADYLETQRPRVLQSEMTQDGLLVTDAEG